jgi:hypothetical protein
MGTTPSDYIMGRMLSLNPMNRTCLALIDQWLETRDHTHSCCGESRIEPALPTRILEIQGQKVIVLLTNGRSARYVALSYCWGNAAPNEHLTTAIDPQDTTATYNPFTPSGVVTSALPKIIRDAITVCPNLCINYLWVDAL